MTDEETKLWTQIKSGDESAINEIFNRYLRFVKSIARRYYRANQDFDDMVQNGNMGLLRAIKGFKLELGFAFPSYARDIIHFAIIRGFQKERLIIIPEDARKTCQITDKDFISLDFIVSEYGDGATIGDMLPSEELSVADILILSENADVLTAALLKLTPTEKTIIEMRYGLIDPEGSTAAECAALLNLSLMQIYQLENRAIRALRQILKEDPDEQPSNL